MDPLQFLPRLSEVPGGGVGFLRDIPLTGSDWTDTNGVIPQDGSDSPSRVAGGLSFDDGDSAYLWISVPGDYDEDDDAFIVRLVATCVTAAAGDTLAISAAQRFREDDAVAGVSLTVPSGGDAQAFPADITTREYDLTGMSVDAGDVVRLTVDGANSGASEVIVAGGWFRYRSDLVLFDQDNR